MRHLKDLAHFLFEDRKQVRFLLIFGIIVGLLVGTIGSAFQIIIIDLTHFKNKVIHLLQPHPILQALFTMAFTTALLVLAIAIVRRFAPEAAGSGVQEIEGTLENKRPLRAGRILPVKFIAGIFSLASGMVLGREGPTIQMGGAIGKLISTGFKLGEERAHILIAAGAGAGLATAFNAPLAGILFVVEEMRSQFRYNFISLQCVILAAIVSGIILRLFMGQQPDIPMTHFHAPPLSSLWLFLIFGALFGCMGFYFNHFLVRTLNIFSHLKRYAFWLAIIALGVTVGLLSLYYPAIIGGGYTVIPQALSYHFTTSALLLIFVLRLATTWTCYGSGAPGGIFAPMLALGTTFGMFFGHFGHEYFPHLVSDPGIFAVAGMSALFTATVGAPLTGIVLVVEMTTNYALILPLVLTCLSATLVTYLLGGHPIYETLLERTLKLAGQPTAKEKN